MRRLFFLLLLIAAPAALAREFRSIGENATPMYDAPSVKANKLFVASRFYPVEVIVQVDNWTKVRDAAGDLAWVEKKTLSGTRTAVVTAALADVRQRAEDGAPRQSAVSNHEHYRTRCRRLGHGNRRQPQYEA